jgi:omega-6 fatty acid desaturase (delta-12 desaturase)
MAINLICGFAGPVLYVCYALGFVVYFNYTHPEIRWYRAMTDSFVDHQASATLYLKFRGISEFLLPSDIMSHAAHHLDTRIPVRHLPKAQECLVSLSGLQIRTEVWSWEFQTKVMRGCKLYDPDQHLWLGFEASAKQRADRPA